jgi:hypothetical protein
MLSDLALNSKSLLEVIRAVPSMWATTLAGYLSLLEGAGLLAGLPKFSKEIIRKKASSPKFQVFDSALFTAWNPDTPSILKEDSESRGQLVESAVGAHLVNEARRTRAKVYYWNNGVHKVDFVAEIKGQLLAIEVKSGRQPRKVSGMKEFLKSYPSARPFIVGTCGIDQGNRHGMSYPRSTEHLIVDGTPIFWDLVFTIFEKYEIDLGKGFKISLSGVQESANRVFEETH